MMCEKRKKGNIGWLVAAGVVVLISLMSAAAALPNCGDCKTECWYQEENIRETYPHDWWYKASCSGSTCLWRHYQLICWQYDVYHICQKRCYCCNNGKWEKDGDPTRELYKKDVNDCKVAIIGQKTLPIGQMP